MSNLPPIQNVDELEDLLSRPTEALVELMGRLAGDLVFLGVGGKMGPTMARMAKRACQRAGVAKRVLGVSRFSNPEARRKLESWGVETVACDLLDQQQVSALPDCQNVIAMTGMKFGAGDQAPRTWAMNCYLPALVCRRYCESRIVAFSTGNVYGMTPVASGGSQVSDPPNAQGEYAMSALGRERIYEFCSRDWGIPLALLRLNYATELRYGVLVDVAVQIKRGEAVDVSMGHVNVIWLADANAMALMALQHVSTPPAVINLAGAEILPLRSVGQRLADLMEMPFRARGEESTDAFLNNGREGYALLGSPQIDAQQMLQWTADWVKRDGELLGKPTHFQVRDGKF